jgi:hypothetical protein
VRVQIYQKSTGTLLRHLGTSGVHGVQAGQFYRPMEMCISPEDGVLLVVDRYNHRVHCSDCQNYELRGTDCAQYLQCSRLKRDKRLLVAWWLEPVVWLEQTPQSTQVSGVICVICVSNALFVGDELFIVY